MDGSEPPMNESQDYALRFEDLTVDDDLPLIDRIVRYCRSGIALQRLVHVKMLAETAETVGCVLFFGTLLLLLQAWGGYCNPGLKLRYDVSMLCSALLPKVDGRSHFSVSSSLLVQHQSNLIDIDSSPISTSRGSGECHSATLGVSIASPKFGIDGTKCRSWATAQSLGNA
jgi:hypothetical protein